MKVNFTEVKAITSFEDATHTFNVCHEIGNLMMFNGNLVLDIGFEDLARTIYYSTAPVEVEEKYVQPLISLIQNDITLKACIKRAIISLLTAK